MSRGLSEKESVSRSAVTHQSVSCLCFRRAFECVGDWLLALSRCSSVVNGVMFGGSECAFVCVGVCLCVLLRSGVCV